VELVYRERDWQKGFLFIIAKWNWFIEREIGKKGFYSPRWFLLLPTFILKHALFFGSFSDEGSKSQETRLLHLNKPGLY